MFNIILCTHDVYYTRFGAKNMFAEIKEKVGYNLRYF